MFPEICSVALNTTQPKRVHSNVELASTVVPKAFWAAMRKRGLATAGPAVTLRHSVHLKLKPEATAEQVRAMAAALDALPRAIPQICALVCGRDAGLAGAANHGFALTVDFEDADGYNTYATHPAHVAVIEQHIKPIIVPGSRTAVQYTLSAL